MAILDQVALPVSQGRLVVSLLVVRLASVPPCPRRDLMARGGNAEVTADMGTEIATM